MKDPRVDAYIDEAPAYARPILEKLRATFHKADPAIEEAIKWGTPTFLHDGMVGGMAVFKKHVAFGFWKAAEMKDPEGLFEGHAKKSHFAIKVSTVRELPTLRVLTAYIKEAVKLNERGIQPTTKRKPPPKPPADFLAALKSERKALATFEGFSPSAQREYVDWITEAKREPTRVKRIATAVEWLAEGKPRNWKYMKTW